MSSGNPDMRPPNLVMELTREQVIEYYRCLTDPKYFISNYCYIIHVKGSKNLFKLFDYQCNMIDNYQQYDRNIVMIGRQLGKCVNAHSLITKDGEKVEIGTIIPLNFKEKIVFWLEQQLLKLSVSKVLKSDKNIQIME